MSNDLTNAINFLSNKSDDEGARDDIAMDFSESDDCQVFGTLLHVAQDENDSEVVRNSCMESLAEILNRNKKNKSYLNNIGSNQLKDALNVIKRNHPSLFKELELNDLE